MLTDKQRSTLENLRQAFDDRLVEEMAEVVELEKHVAEALRRVKATAALRAIVVVRLSKGK
jgi:hypothetical protein